MARIRHQQGVDDQIRTFYSLLDDFKCLFSQRLDVIHHDLNHAKPVPSGTVGKGTGKLIRVAGQGTELDPVQGGKTGKGRRCSQAHAVPARPEAETLGDERFHITAGTIGEQKDEGFIFQRRRRSQIQLADIPLHHLRGAVQRSQFGLIQGDGQDLLHPSPPDHRGQAEVDILDAVIPGHQIGN